MTKFQTAIVGRRAKAALRLLAVGGLAAMLAGCNQTHKSHKPNIRPTIACAIPITLKEGDRTVEVFVGRNRGGLTPVQRADVLAFAQLWRREATSGIIVDVPQGGATDQAAADSMREIHSILAASGVPRNAVYVRNYRPSAIRARQHQDQLFENDRATPALAASGRTISARRSDVDLHRKSARTGISAAPASAISPPWSTIRPISFSRAAKRRLTPPAAPSRSTNTARATTRPALIPDMTPAKSAISANDKTRSSSRSRRRDGSAVDRAPTPPPTNISRRRRGSRCRPFASRSKPPPPCRRPARIAAWSRPMSKSRWAAPPPRSRPIALRRRRTSSSSRPSSAPTTS